MIYCKIIKLKTKKNSHIANLNFISLIKNQSLTIQRISVNYVEINEF